MNPMLKREATPDEFYEERMAVLRRIRLLGVDEKLRVDALRNLRRQIEQLERLGPSNAREHAQASTSSRWSVSS